MENTILAEVRATLLRMEERLETLEGLFRANLEHTREADARVHRMLRAAAIITSDCARHDD